MLENSTAPSTYARKLHRDLSSNSSLYLRRLPITEYTKDRHEHNVDILVLLFNRGNDKINHFINTIEETKVRRSLLLIIGPWKDNEEDDFKSNLEMTKNMWFYVAYIISESYVMWKEVITLQTGYTINQLKFLNGSLKVKEEYNLNGLKIRATSLTWAPFLTIDNCNEEGLECEQNYGYLKDYMDALATELNFTYETYKDLGCDDKAPHDNFDSQKNKICDFQQNLNSQNLFSLNQILNKPKITSQNNDWGTSPKSGPYNLSGTWGGVMGDVITKKYDLSLSGWVWNTARYPLAQFVPINKKTDVCAWTPKNPETDYGLFTRD